LISVVHCTSSDDGEFPLAETALMSGTMTVVIDRDLLSGPLALVTAMVKLLVAAVVGVPVIAPVDEFKLRPVGNDPTGMLQEGLVQLTLPINVCEYAILT
jgi:hypothetical protein